MACGMVCSMVYDTAWSTILDQSEKVRENRLREVARRRGYELRKSRRRDPLALDYGEWYLTRGSIEGMPMQTVTLSSLDSVESFLDGELGPPASRQT
jgi:hypothetical protein